MPHYMNLLPDSAASIYLALIHPQKKQLVVMGHVTSGGCLNLIFTQYAAEVS